MNRISNISKGGLFTALSLIFIYFSNVMPTNKLSFLTLASSIIPLSIMSIGIKNALIVYLSSSILSLLLGLRGSAIVYIILFGNYGFVKYYIEALRKVYLELILKFLYFNFATIISLYLYKLLVLDVPKTNFSIALIILLLQVGFFIYDYALTIIIAYINKHLKRILK